jgi:hypothetical protein
MTDNGLLSIVAVSEDRFQVVDMRGRQVGGFTSHLECVAFVQGYLVGRDDAAIIAQQAVAALPARIMGDR